jgi:hypothetical protein
MIESDADRGAGGFGKLGVTGGGAKTGSGAFSLDCGVTGGGTTIAFEGGGLMVNDWSEVPIAGPCGIGIAVTVDEGFVFPLEVCNSG